MEADSETAFERVSKLRVRLEALGTRKYRIERLLEYTLPEGMRRLDFDQGGIRQALTDARAARRTAPAVSEKPDDDLINGLVESLARLRKREQRLGRLAERLPESLARVREEIASASQTLMEAEIKTCEGGTNWYELLDARRRYEGSFSNRRFGAAVRNLGLLPTNRSLFNGQRLTSLNLRREDPENLEQTISGILTLLPYYAPEHEGYVPFYLFKTPTQPRDDVPPLLVPHDLSHAFVGDEEFDSLESAVAHMQATYGTRPARKSPTEPDVREAPLVAELRERQRRYTEQRDALRKEAVSAIKRLNSAQRKLENVSRDLKWFDLIKEGFGSDWSTLLDATNRDPKIVERFERDVRVLGLWPLGVLKQTGQRAVEIRMDRDDPEVGHRILTAIKTLLPHYKPAANGRVYFGIRDHEQSKTYLTISPDLSRVEVVSPRHGREVFGRLDEALVYVQREHWLTTGKQPEHVWTSSVEQEQPAPKF